MKNETIHNGFLHRGLIKAAAARVKTIGIVIGILVAIHAVLAPVLSISAAMSSQYDLFGSSIMKYNVGAEDVLSLLPLLCMFGAFIMTVTAFKYLNQRNSSDFFHALSQKRTTVFFSNIAGVMSVVSAIAVLGGVMSCIMGLALSAALILDYLSILMLVINTIVGSLLVVSATALAMSITGTTLSNIVVSAIILFLPNTIIMLFNIAVGLSLPSNTLLGTDIFYLIDKYNIVTGGIFNFGVFQSGWALLYTSVLACVYAALGAYLYKRRRSEIAGNSAPSRLMQAIYRILVGFAMFSVITAVMFGVVYSPLKFGQMRDFGLIFLLFFIAYLIAAILYFLYELITTKKWKNVARAIPGLGIVILMSAAMFAAMAGVYDSKVYFSPKAEEIEYVSFIDDIGNVYSLESYYLKDIEEEKITDAKVKQVVADTLADMLNETKNGTLGMDGTSHVYLVEIKTKNRLEKKYIYVPDKENAAIQKMYEEKRNSRLASIDAIQLEPQRCWISNYSKQFTAQEIDEAIRCAVNEFRGISLSEWIERQEMYDNWGGNSYYIEYRLDMPENGFSSVMILLGSSKSFSIPISPYTLPQTYELLESYSK